MNTFSWIVSLLLTSFSSADEAPLSPCRLAQPQIPDGVFVIGTDLKTKREFLAQQVGDGDVVFLGDPLAPDLAQRYSFDAAEIDPPPQAEDEGVHLKLDEEAGTIEVRIRGELFTTYVFKGAPKPYFFPVLGPGGERITRGWPMEEGANEEKDHPHQRSLYFAFGELNGVDFWAEGPNRGQMRHAEIEAVYSGLVVGGFRTRSTWVSSEGKFICNAITDFRAWNTEGSRLFDVAVTIQAWYGPLTFGDTKEGMMAMRLAPTMRVQGDVGKGHILNAAGHRDGETWGKRSAWCDYSGPVIDAKGNESTLGVAILDHPSNLRHPTWWHVRTYGLFAANPFGLRHFEKTRPGTGNHTVERGRTLTFRYRFYIHPGDATQARVPQAFDAYRAWHAK